MDALNALPPIDAAPTNAPTAAASAPDPAAPGDPAMATATTPGAEANPPRPWLVPVVVGVVAGFLLAAWWMVIDTAVPCDPSAASMFGLLAIFLLGGIAAVGVGIVVESRQAARRRIGRAMLLAAGAATVPFLILTLLLSFVIGGC